MMDRVHRFKRPLALGLGVAALALTGLAGPAAAENVLKIGVLGRDERPGGVLGAGQQVLRRDHGPDV